MFYKIEDYLTFFQNVKNNAPTLKKGTVPKVDFSGSPVYIIIAAFGFFAFSFMNGFVIGLFLLLGIFALPFVLVLYFCFFMTLTVLMQMNYYHIRKKDTSFWYLWNYNMYRIVHHRFTVCLMTGCLTPMANYLMRLCEYFKLRKPLLVLKYCNIQYLMARYPEITPCITQPIEEPGTYISPDDFTLLLGASTGLMSDLWHGSSLAAGQNVLLNLNEVSVLEKLLALCSLFCYNCSIKAVVALCSTSKGMLKTPLFPLQNIQIAIFAFWGLYRANSTSYVGLHLKPLLPFLNRL